MSEMIGWIQCNSSNLHDQDTGRLVGYLNPVTQKEVFTCAVVVDAESLILTEEHLDTQRKPSGTLTYTVDASTGWPECSGIPIWLPVSGTISFAASGGATLNSATDTLTRTMADNQIGYVVLTRRQGTNTFGLSGA